MSSRTCAYVASKNDPEGWHGTDPSNYHLDRDPGEGGLGITEWHCPHPPFKGDDVDDQYCVFHTDPEKLPNGAQRGALLNALNDAGDRPKDNRPEHRGQFVGATFGTIDLSKETIVATDDYDIRFDHAQFHSDDEDLIFEDTTFETRGQYPISFARADLTIFGNGHIRFRGATFKAAGDGDVWFQGTTFRAAGDGDVWFEGTTFKTDGHGDVWFGGATFNAGGDDGVRFGGASFRTARDGLVWFEGGTFRAAGDGDVWFGGAIFRTDGIGDVVFGGAEFRTDGNGDVWFRGATFRIAGDGGVWFGGATFRITGNGNVRFQEVTCKTDGNCSLDLSKAKFRTIDDGRVLFGGANLTDAVLKSVDFDRASFLGVTLTGTDLREASIADISVNGATTCEQLNEGTTFDSEDWDATARAYHDLKTVFGDHGLVGKARDTHIRERRARRLEAKATSGVLDKRFLGSLFSRIFTGYGVQVKNLLIWMAVLFFGSTAVYVFAGVEDTLVDNVSYSVRAFVVAPPPDPLPGILTKVVMMVETFFGTLSIVLLGYILGNRERF